MKKFLIITISLVLSFGLGLSARAASPVFLGATTDFITNSSGTITFVFSNNTRVVYHRGFPLNRTTNSVVGESLVQNYGTVDTNGAVRFDFSFGDSGGSIPGFSWELLFTTNGVFITDGVGNTPLYIDRTNSLVTLTKQTATGYAEEITTVAGVGGANTNFTMQARESLVHINAGTTNVNIVAIMGGDATREWEGGVVFTNRTATARTISFSSATNNWIALQNFDGLTDATNAAPIVVTNSQAVYLWRRVKGSNVVYAFKHASLPAN